MPENLNEPVNPHQEDYDRSGEIGKIEGECPICKSEMFAEFHTPALGCPGDWSLFHSTRADCPGIIIGTGWSLQDLQKEWDKQRHIAKRLILKSLGPR